MIQNVEIPSKSIEFGAKIDSECKKSANMKKTIKNQKQLKN